MRSSLIASVLGGASCALSAYYGMGYVAVFSGAVCVLAAGESVLVWRSER